MIWIANALTQRTVAMEKINYSQVVSLYVLPHRPGFGGIQGGVNLPLSEAIVRALTLAVSERWGATIHRGDEVMDITAIEAMYQDPDFPREE
jgi:hypothetical protein